MATIPITTYDTVVAQPPPRHSHGPNHDVRFPLLHPLQWLQRRTRRKTAHWADIQAAMGTSAYEITLSMTTCCHGVIVGKASYGKSTAAALWCWRLLQAGVHVIFLCGRTPRLWAAAQDAGFTTQHWSAVDDTHLDITLKYGFHSDHKRISLTVVRGTRISNWWRTPHQRHFALFSSR